MNDEPPVLTVSQLIAELQKFDGDLPVMHPAVYGDPADEATGVICLSKEYVSVDSSDEYEENHYIEDQNWSDGPSKPCVLLNNDVW